MNTMKRRIKSMESSHLWHNKCQIKKNLKKILAEYKSFQKRLKNEKNFKDEISS